MMVVIETTTKLPTTQINKDNFLKQSTKIKIGQEHNNLIARNKDPTQ